jgi:hypothetical protein
VVFLRFSLNIRKGMGYRESVASALNSIPNDTKFVLKTSLFKYSQHIKKS